MRDSREFYKDVHLVQEYMHAMLKLSGLLHKCMVEGEWRWWPPADMYETDEFLIIVIEVAGMSEGSFKITLQGRMLTVAGRRNEYPIEGKIAYHNWEIDNGHFERTFYIPEKIDAEDIKAIHHYENGYLVIKLPRKKSSREIPVE